MGVLPGIGCPKKDINIPDPLKSEKLHWFGSLQTENVQKKQKIKCGARQSQHNPAIFCSFGKHGAFKHPLIPLINKPQMKYTIYAKLVKNIFWESYQKF